MQFLAQYPLSEANVNPLIGRPVGAILGDGDFAYGVVDRLHNGHVVFRPIDGATTAQVQSMKNKLKSHPQIKAAMERAKEAKTKAWGGYGGYPYGWGYGNYGWGAGWWWIWPLFFILAFVAWPFFW